MDAATLEHLILREIRKSEEISRRDLADLLGIARSTAGRRVDKLIEDGLLREKGVESRDSAGRPRRFLELQGTAGAFVGLDFDARRIYAKAVDFAQNSLTEETVELERGTNAANVLQILRDLRETLAERVDPVPLLATGIGLPGSIRQETRTGIIYPYIDGWENIDLVKELDCPKEQLFIENNTRAAALGNYTYGGFGAAGVEHLVCLNVRTGISSAVISHGTLISGRHEMAGEIRGWPAAGPENLESVATARAIDGKWQDFAKAVRNDDRAALETLTELSEYHGIALSQIVQLVDPETVVLMGAFASLGESWLTRVRAATARALNDTYFEVPSIELSTLGDFSGALGAASLAADLYRTT